jgi:hypothetical protein
VNVAAGGLFFQGELLLRISQQAAFTLHAESTALTEIKGDKILARYEIPAASKKDVRDRLAWLGFRTATVYPDLENLAAELRAAEFLHTRV